MDWITQEAISTGVQVQNWQEAVRAVGDLLIQTGAAEPRYVEAMLQSARELGPYFVLAPGLALPHARPEDGALRTGFAAITLSEPVSFGNPDNDPVRLVVAFCAPDTTSHLHSLTALARRLGEAGFIERAASAGSAAELFALFTGGKTEP